MKRRLYALVHRLSPRTFDGLHDLAVARERHGSIAERFDALDPGDLVRAREELERQIAELRAEIDELRSEGRHVAELYDLVFERVREERTKTGSQPE